MDKTTATGSHVPLGDNADKTEHKRKRQDGIDSVDEKKLKADDDPKPESVRLKVKKFAILLSYCGADYFGLQR